METLWIARDKSGLLYVYENRPIQRTSVFASRGYEGHININKKMFPEVTWENSPKQIEVKLIKTENKDDIIMKLIGILLLISLMIIPINIIITLINLLT